MLFEGLPAGLVLAALVGSVMLLSAYTWRTKADKQRARDARIIRRMERDLRDDD